MQWTVLHKNRLCLAFMLTYTPRAARNNFFQFLNFPQKRFISSLVQFFFQRQEDRFLLEEIKTSFQAETCFGFSAEENLIQQRCSVTSGQSYKVFYACDHNIGNFLVSNTLAVIIYKRKLFIRSATDNQPKNAHSNFLCYCFKVAFSMVSFMQQVCSFHNIYLKNLLV